MQGVVAAAQVANGVEKAVNVQDKSHQHTGCDSLPEHSRPTQPDHQAGGDGPENIHTRAEHRRDAGRGKGALEVVAIDIIPEVLVILLLPGECLDNAHAVDVLCQDRVDPGDGGADLSIGQARCTPEKDGNEHHDRQDAEGE